MFLGNKQKEVSIGTYFSKLCIINAKVVAGYVILTIKVDYKKYLFGSKILTEISKSTI